MEEESASEYSSSEQLLTETITSSEFRDYIVKLITLLLEASEEDINTCVNDENFNPIELENFIKDNVIQTLFIIKEKIDDNQGNNNCYKKEEKLVYFSLLKILE